MRARPYVRLVSPLPARGITVAQVLGTNGVGKSTLTRHLASGGLVVEGLTFVPASALVILGDYSPSIKTPGCDRLHTRDAVIAELERAVALAEQHGYRTVLFEGMMVATVKTYYHVCVDRGWLPKYLHIQVPHDVSLARIQARTGRLLKQGGGKVAEHAEHARVVATFVAAQGAPVLALDGTHSAPENAWRVLQFLGETAFAHAG